MENQPDHSKNCKAHLKGVFSEASDRAVNGFMGSLEKLIEQKTEEKIGRLRADIQSGAAMELR